MKKISVLHCLGQLNVGGAETLVMNILRNIDRDKFQFDFLVFNNEPGFFDNEVKSLGCHIYFLPAISDVGIKKYICQLIRFFRKKNIDIVHSHMDWQGGFISYAAFKSNIKKIVIHSHTNQELFEYNTMHKIIIKVNKYLIKRYATDLCACSKDAGISLFDKKKFTIITNGIDVKKYIHPNQEKIEQMHKELNIDKNDIVLGNVGSFSENKNQIFLLKILKKLVNEDKKYKLILVGDGILKKQLEKEVKNNQLNENVVFMGIREDIPEIMHLFSIFLFPSKIEGLGIVAIEAQACGIPCIVSETIPKEVDMKIGLVKFKNLDKYLWIEAIKEIRRNNYQNIKISDDSIYSINYTIQQICDIYSY